MTPVIQLASCTLMLAVRKYFNILLLVLKLYFLIRCYTWATDSLELVLLVHIAQILALEVQLLSAEVWLQAKDSTGHRWDSNPGSCYSMAITASALNHCAT